MAKNNLDFEKRKYVIGGIAFAIVAVYIIQLFNLQIIKPEYKNYADNNAFFNRILYPTRGVMTDRNGKLIVYNQPTSDIVFIPREITFLDTLEFCRTLNISREWFEKRMADIKDRRQNPGYSTYTLQTFMTQLDMKASSLFQEKLYKFPGFFIQNRTVRQYNYPNAGLVLGYVAEVDRRQLEKDNYYIMGDYVGKSGLEHSYEKYLRGKKGVEILLRDARGRIQGRYEDGKNDVAPVSGRNLTLSIDMNLQAYGEYLMQNKKGAIIMIEPSSGEILCMVTAPSYDPSLLVGRDFGKNYRELEENPINPLYNNAIQGQYPPGSTFKTTQGLIFLQENALSTSTLYPCNHGYPPLGGKPACHGHPSPLSIESAISTSCNSFFCYGLTSMLSDRSKYKDINQAFDVWRDHLVAMGFGYTLGVDLPFEKRGFIPNSKFYNKVHKSDNWKPANIISIAIGQGEVLITPLQGANLAATIANRGYFYTPHLVKAIQDTVIEKKYTEKHFTGIDKKYYDVIADGMAGSVTKPIGTCKVINMSPDIEVCGKTGTVQNPHGKDHSAFMGFAPKDNPRVAIFVFVENGGWGATYGVPIGRLMFQKFFKGEIPESDKWIEDRIVNSVLLPNQYLSWKNAKRNAN